MWLSIFVASLCYLCIRVIMALYKELGQVLSDSILQNDLRGTDANSSLKIWFNSAQNISGTTVSILLGILLITASVH